MNYEKYEKLYPAIYTLTNVYLMEQDFNQFLNALKENPSYAENVIKEFKPDQFSEEFYSLLTLNENLFNWISVNLFSMEDEGYLANVKKLSLIVVTILNRHII